MSMDKRMEAITQRYEKDRQYLANVYTQIPEPNVEHAKSTMDFEDVRSNRAQLLERLGILQRRTEYGRPSQGEPLGRKSFWTLLVPRDEAERLLAKHHDESFASSLDSINAGFKKAPETRRKNREARAQELRRAEAELDELPEPPRANLSAAEQVALIERARSYTERRNIALARLDELASSVSEAGISFDKKAAYNSFHFDDVDPELEAISLIVPFIDRLEETIDELLKANKASLPHNSNATTTAATVTTSVSAH